VIQSNFVHLTDGSLGLHVLEDLKAFLDALHQRPGYCRFVGISRPYVD